MHTVQYRGIVTDERRRTNLRGLSPDSLDIRNTRKRVCPAYFKSELGLTFTFDVFLLAQFDKGPSLLEMDTEDWIPTSWRSKTAAQVCLSFPLSSIKIMYSSLVVI